MKWWYRALLFLGFREESVKHPSPETFRMPNMNPLQVELLALHIRQTPRRGGAWGR